SPGALSPGMKPPPNFATSVKVCGSPPWSATLRVVPSLILSVSGSKSQPWSGCPAAAFAHKSDNVVNAPIVTFLQKSGPSAALKTNGEHSTKDTNDASRGECSCS